MSSQWTEHKNAQGRVYWYHKGEKKSVWEKPTELKTARERALDSTPWKEYQSGDRKYYVHSVTKESSWSLPAELKDLFDSIPSEPSPQTTPLQNAQRETQSPHPPPTAPSSQRPLYSGPPPGFESPGHAVNGSGSPAPYLVSSQLSAQKSGSSSGTIVVEGGEDAFLQLLREKGVDPSWTWEQTMREIITEPLYKALKTLAERKAAFSKYIRTLEEEAEKVRHDKAKSIEPSIRKMMEEPITSKRVQHWLSYEGMLLRCPDASLWHKLASVSETEARTLWATMRRTLREEEEQQTRELRERNKLVLMKLLRKFEADVTTRWKDAHQTVLESDEWRSDAALRGMEMTDMIAVFDELVRSIEDEKRQEVRDETKKQHRDERKRRDWFKALLLGCKRDGWLTVETTFGQIYDRFRGEKSFQEMLGQHGSTPLDLFYDVLDEMHKALEKIGRVVGDVLEAQKPPMRISESTSLADFKKVLKEALADSKSNEYAILADASQEDLKLIYADFVHRSKEEARRIDRKLRHLGEDVRYALKKVIRHHPEVFGEESDLDKPWDEWKVRIASLQLREWDAFENTQFRIDASRIEEARKAAWDRFVVRQKEKLAEQKMALSSVHASGKNAGDVPRKRRGDEDEKVDDSLVSSSGALEKKRASREISRRERRAGYLDEPSAAKRPRKEDGAEEDEDSEKEEGEV